METQELFRLIVAGSRDFNDYKFLEQKLDKLLANIKDKKKILIVSGTANGADLLGEHYASRRGYEIKRYPADWQRYGRQAGYLRNVQMAENADACVIFRVNESSGSTHMKNIAEERKLPYRLYDSYK